ncbi:MAG: hypothetical protein H0V70_18830 [Ktedonobacteraceae bacterium]|nr:hypothetical protein [Ktedonobacteraceae bacterium]
MNKPVICLVTIHGVGFEQSPTLDEDGMYTIIPGYADPLHEYLSGYLDETWLSDDPLRSRRKRGEAGPIYVSSVWPANTQQRENGLKRLGTWDQTHFRDVDGTDAPLTDGTGRISHIALV